MFTKISFLFAAAFYMQISAQSQVINLDENKPTINDGIEYGYKHTVAPMPMVKGLLQKAER
jgi:hypothetical protein